MLMLVNTAKVIYIITKFMNIHKTITKANFKFNISPQIQHNLYTLTIFKLFQINFERRYLGSKHMILCAELMILFVKIYDIMGQDTLLLWVKIHVNMGKKCRIFCVKIYSITRQIHVKIPCYIYL